MLPLTVIICTYKREEAVGKTLALLFGPEVQASHSVELRVIVVDQARTLQRSDFPEDWNLRIVHQDNFGGAGGFTRGMMEGVAEGAGWILLMDDDATPDPASFPVLADYINRRAPDTRFALHGAMFSSEQPNTIYEAGATIKEPKEKHFDIVQRLRGYKPETPVATDPRLSENPDIDYGAWWCFCLHTDTVAEAGLPLPLFIRGDDCEYGLRLKRRGIPTIALPGLRIWHPAHSDRLDLWYFVFDWRNKFIIKTLHGLGRPRQWATTFSRLAFYKLLTAQYEMVEMMALGLQEFLRGPASLLDPPAKLLQHAQQLDGQSQPLPADGNATLNFLPRVSERRLWRNIWQTATLNGLLFPAAKRDTGSIPAFHAGQFDWLATYRLPAYALVSASAGQMRICRRSLKRFLVLGGKLAVLVTRYLFTSAKLGRLYRERVSYLSSAAFWTDTLTELHTPLELPGSRQSLKPFSHSLEPIHTP
jgi:galactofuranosylgalactofuranosylrhamnosyl-N-acetylglucosaminyl-diphospho-decaprenol beta-1,5/1,6-galactofuranosyltransferase